MKRNLKAGGKGSATPIALLCGFIETTSMKDAAAYARGIAERRFVAVENAWWAVERCGDGFLYEVHEGGSGAGWLPQVLKALEQPPHRIRIPTGERVLEVFLRDGKPVALLHPSEDSKGGGDPALRPTGKMKRVVDPGTGVLAFGAAFFGTGLCVLAAGATLLVLARSPVVPPPLVPPDLLPHRQYASIALPIDEPVHAKALRFDGQFWTVEWSDGRIDRTGGMAPLRTPTPRFAAPVVADPAAPKPGAGAPNGFPAPDAPGAAPAPQGLGSPPPLPLPPPVGASAPSALPLPMPPTPPLGAPVPPPPGDPAASAAPAAVPGEGMAPPGVLVPPPGSPAPGVAPPAGVPMAPPGTPVPLPSPPALEGSPAGSLPPGVLPREALGTPPGDASLPTGFVPPPAPLLAPPGAPVPLPSPPALEGAPAGSLPPGALLSGGVPPGALRAPPGDVIPGGGGLGAPAAPQALPGAKPMPVAPAAPAALPAAPGLR